MSRLALVGAASVLFVFSLITPTASTADQAKRVAVLELQGVFEPSALAILTDQLRQGALLTLRDTGYEIMTRENMAMLARDMGLDLAACEEEAECEVDIGRNIGADLVVSGGIAHFGSKLTATIKVHDTHKGTLLATRNVRASTEDELFDSLPEAAVALLDEALGIGKRVRRSRSAPTGGGGAIREDSASFSMDALSSEVIVSFSSSPPGAAVLLDGEMLCSATPCKREIGLGKHRVQMHAERHEPASKLVEVESSTTVALTLEPRFGRLSVITDPPGLEISLNGKVLGKTPVPAAEVDPDLYRVIVTDPCYLRDGKEVAMGQGQEETVYITARPRVAGLEIRAREEDGNAVSAQVTVDGQLLGKTPGRLRLPVCSQEVVLTAPGFEDWRKKLKLKENNLSTFTAHLRPLAGSLIEQLLAGSLIDQLSSQTRAREQSESMAAAHAREKLDQLSAQAERGQLSDEELARLRAYDPLDPNYLRAMELRVLHFKATANFEERCAVATEVIGHEKHKARAGWWLNKATCSFENRKFSEAVSLSQSAIEFFFDEGKFYEGPKVEKILLAYQLKAEALSILYWGEKDGSGSRRSDSSRRDEVTNDQVAFAWAEVMSYAGQIGASEAWKDAKSKLDELSLSPPDHSWWEDDN